MEYKMVQRSEVNISRWEECVVSWCLAGCIYSCY